MYRDDLEASRQRIAGLEQKVREQEEELAALRRGASRTVPALTRRAAAGGLLALGLAAVAGAALAARAVPRSRRDMAERLVRTARDISDALARGEITQIAWQDALETLLRGTAADELAAAIDLDALVAGAPEVARGASVLPLPLVPAPEDRPRFATKLFVLRKGRANPPHTHDNMVSVHYVLRGRFLVRHFERVRDEPHAFVLRPTIDRVLGPGHATSISDMRDNVHWHLAEADGVLLDILRVSLDPSRGTDTTLVDPIRAERLDGGLLRAPIIPTVEEALARFG